MGAEVVVVDLAVAAAAEVRNDFAHNALVVKIKHWFLFQAGLMFLCVLETHVQVRLLS